MKMVNLAAVAAFVLLAAGPALAGDPRGGHLGGGGGGGGCGGGCGGGHRPPAHGGGYGGNINVNVNANANASAYAGASARGYVNARAYDMGGHGGGYRGGSTVYVGGGYGGEVGGYYGGGAIYNEEAYAGRTCASAPFGYVVGGFGREGRRAPACVAGASVCRESIDRGGRYGYSEHRGCDGGRREHYEGGYEESGGRASYEYSEAYSESYREESYGYAGGHAEGGDYGIGDYERGYIDGSRSCGACRADDDRGGPHPPRDRDRDHGYGYEQPYAPSAPAYPAPHYQAPPYQPSAYDAPMTPNQYYGLGDQPPPPRQHYSQEPGERG